MSESKSGEVKITPPPVYWAQRSSLLFVTIGLEDCKDPILNIEKEKIFFKGVGGLEKKEHEVTIDLFSSIVPDGSKTNVTGRNIELVLKKEEEGPFWPRLTKEKKKYHWLKIDFSRWKDEDDSDVDAFDGEVGLDEMMKSMGCLDGSDDKPSMDDLPDDKSESDDDLPDLE